MFCFSEYNKNVYRPTVTVALTGTNLPVVTVAAKPRVINNLNEKKCVTQLSGDIPLVIVSTPDADVTTFTLQFKFPCNTPDDCSTINGSAHLYISLDSGVSYQVSGSTSTVEIIDNEFVEIRFDFTQQQQLFGADPSITIPAKVHFEINYTN
jgi:hypothetical protein